MAKINCPGDCTTCELLRNGEVNPSECASIWGFMGVQRVHEGLETMRVEMDKKFSEIMRALASESKQIPGIEYAPAPEEEVPTAEGAETPATPEV